MSNLPLSNEKNVWDYFADKAKRQAVELSTLLTEVLRRDIEISEALKEPRLRAANRRPANVVW